MFKKAIIVILLSLFSINIFSQIQLSKEEAKTLCLILNEHEKFSIENPLLKQQIISLENLNQFYIQTDSIQKIEIKEYNERVISDDKKIKKLESSRKKLLVGSSVGGIILFIIGLIL